LKMAIEIVDLPIHSMVIFHSYVNVYQRVPINRPFSIAMLKLPRVSWFQIKE
jgi:hypothetical protein